MTQHSLVEGSMDMNPAMVAHIMF